MTTRDQIINNRLKKLLQQRDNFLQSEIRLFEKELLEAYEKALANINAGIKAFHSAYGQNIKLEDLPELTRLENLKTQIQTEIKKLNLVTENLYTELKSSLFEAAFYRTGFAFEKAAALNLNFGLLNPSVVEAAISARIFRKSFTKIKTYNEIISRQILKNLETGLLEGKGFAAIERENRLSVFHKFNELTPDQKQGTVYKVKRILRTEGTRAQAAGNQAGYERAAKSAERLGIGIKKIWDAVLDLRTRPNHGDMDGVAANKEGLFKFRTMDGKVIFVKGPHLTNTYDDINCRCSDRYQVGGMEPTVRRDNISKQIVKYKTYNEYFKGRIQQTNPS
jgi:hypothetical protein